MNSTNRYPCPCCGYRTYFLPADGTMQICPVCFWEDGPGEYSYTSSNEVSLATAQRQFLAHGACESQFEDIVRAPFPEEKRSKQWQSFDALSETIINDIELSFRDVSREGGTTLHQMDLADGGWPIREEAMRDAENQDPEVRWQDIASDKLATFYGSLCFLDDWGYRFYLPAFMRHALITSRRDVELAELDGVLWSLDHGPDPSRRAAFSLLNLEQKQATAAFLYLLALQGGDSQQCYAEKGLQNGWDAFVPIYIKLPFA